MALHAGASAAVSPHSPTCEVAAAQRERHDNPLLGRLSGYISPPTLALGCRAAFVPAAGFITTVPTEVLHVITVAKEKKPKEISVLHADPDDFARMLGFDVHCGWEDDG